MVEILDSMFKVWLWASYSICTSIASFIKRGIVVFLSWVSVLMFVKPRARPGIVNFTEAWAMGLGTEKLVRVTSKVMSHSRGLTWVKFCAVLRMRSWLFRELLFFFFWLSPGFFSYMMLMHSGLLNRYLVEATFLLSFWFAGFPSSAFIKFTLLSQKPF